MDMSSPLTAKSGSEASFLLSRYSILYARFKTFEFSRVFDIKTNSDETCVKQLTLSVNVNQ